MKPLRSQLAGFSPSQFKTFLRRKGHKVPRDFFRRGCVSKHDGRLYRWRWWGDEGFFVDVSCDIADFDRWANSVELTIRFDDAAKEGR